VRAVMVRLTTPPLQRDWAAASTSPRHKAVERSNKTTCDTANLYVNASEVPILVLGRGVRRRPCVGPGLLNRSQQRSVGDVAINVRRLHWTPPIRAVQPIGMGYTDTAGPGEVIAIFRAAPTGKRVHRTRPLEVVDVRDFIVGPRR